MADCYYHGQSPPGPCPECTPEFRAQQEQPKRCEACRATGLIHCSDPENCGGPWSKPIPYVNAWGYTLEK